MGYYCIHNRLWTCRYTPRRNLKHRTFLLVDISEVSTVAVLSSNQNEAYIGCRFETWSTDLNKLNYMGQECVHRSCEIMRSEASN